MTEAAHALLADPYEAACDHAIATCNGDMRARGLLTDKSPDSL
ncbi:hypothetical protein [Tardiphaga robiniae]|nr:hypothetical protein [Tardiphaga robiniae]